MLLLFCHYHCNLLAVQLLRVVDSATASLTARSVLAVLAGIGISTGKYWTLDSGAVLKVLSSEMDLAEISLFR
jgi:hypothetical protein